MAIVRKRTVPTVVAGAIGRKETIAPFYMVFLDFNGMPRRIHNSIGDIPFDNHTWTGVGNFGSITPIVEEKEGKSTDVAVRLEGVDSTLINQARGLDYEDRTAQLLVGFRSLVSGAFHGAIELRYGVMSNIGVVDGQHGGPSYIDVTLIDEISLLDKSKALFWDQPTFTQKLGNATSTLFRHTPILKNLDFKLGPVRSAGSSRDRNRNDFYWNPNDPNDLPFT